MLKLIKNARLIDPALEIDGVYDFTITKEGTIGEVAENIDEKEFTETYADADVLDATGLVALPGLVDLHVHFRDPGQEYKEDIFSGTRAAVHGGFTHVCTMPNTDPICDTASTVKYQKERAEESGLCEVHPIGALTKGLRGEELCEYYDMSRAGACAFSDDGRGVQTAGVLRRSMDYLSGKDLLAISHCEDESLSKPGVVNEGIVSTRLGMTGWPVLAEELQISRDAELAKLTGCRLHIAHITSKEGVQIVNEAKEDGVQITCEVTPHHLFLCEDDIDESYNTNFKMNPPLRTKEDMEYLQQALIEGEIDCVATDHAPHATHEKQLEFELAPFGIIGLETAFALVYTNLVKNGSMTLSRLVEVMSLTPRKIARLSEAGFAAGLPCDVALFELDEEFEVASEDFESKAKNQPYTGMKLFGKAKDVFLGTKQLLSDGEVVEN